MSGERDAGRQAALLAFLSGERRGPAAAAARGGLTALAMVYSVGLKAYLLPYGLGLRRRARLGVPVISVGNLTVGGTGKTPMARLAAETLLAHGLRVCVLVRGYRGENEHGAAVVSDGRRVLLDARAAGDEAHLLAGLLPGVPVLVGKDRRRTGALAVEQFAPDVVVLDDGMQFYQLHRDLDIVLLDARRPFDNGWTLPRGLLREPPGHLRRAGAVVITHADEAEGDALAALEQRVRRLAGPAPIFRAAYRATGLRALGRAPAVPMDWLAGRQVGTLCAIAGPAAFEAQVEGLGAQLVARTRLDDHAEPTMGGLRAAMEAAAAAGAEALVVTEKDAVKLPPIDRPLSIYALEVRQELDRPRAFADLLLRAAGRDARTEATG